MGLSNLYDNEPDVRLILRKFLALALLPRNQIKTCFKLLCKDSDIRIQLWLIDMPPDLWCVADSAIKTNNNSEGK